MLNRNLRKACSIIIGDSNPKFKSINNYKNIEYMGQYCPYQHEIVLYRNNISDIDKYVQVYIHEWTHSTQKGIKKNYVKMDYKYGYSKNPYEIEARDNEKVFKSIIWRVVKRML
jgi:hypothetical protein